MTVRATWRDDAACRDADPDLFFPIGTTGPALVQIGEAKRICRGLPGASLVPGLGAGERGRRRHLGRHHAR
jgi:Transcription factor WhiB